MTIIITLILAIFSIIAIIIQIDKKPRLVSRQEKTKIVMDEDLAPLVLLYSVY